MTREGAWHWGFTRLGYEREWWCIAANVYHGASGPPFTLIADVVDVLEELDGVVPLGSSGL